MTQTQICIKHTIYFHNPEKIQKVHLIKASEYKNKQILRLKKKIKC